MKCLYCHMLLAFLLLNKWTTGGATATAETESVEDVDTYQAVEGDVTLKLVQPKAKLPILRDIVYYHIIEKPYPNDRLIDKYGEDKIVESDYGYAEEPENLQIKDQQIEDEQIKYEQLKDEQIEDVQIEGEKITHEQIEDEQIKNEPIQDEQIEYKEIEETHTKRENEQEQSVRTKRSIIRENEEDKETYQAVGGDLALKLIQPKAKQPKLRDILYQRIIETPYPIDQLTDKYGDDKTHSIRTKRSILRNIPEAPTLPPLNLQRLPSYVRNMITKELPEPKEHYLKTNEELPRYGGDVIERRNRAELDNIFEKLREAAEAEAGADAERAPRTGGSATAAAQPKTWGVRLFGDKGTIWNELAAPNTVVRVGDTPVEDNKEEMATDSTIDQNPDIEVTSDDGAYDEPSTINVHDKHKDKLTHSKPTEKPDEKDCDHKDHEHSDNDISVENKQSKDKVKPRVKDSSKLLQNNHKGDYEEVNENYEEVSENYEEDGENYEEDGENYEEDGENYEDDGENYEEDGENYEEGGENDEHENDNNTDEGDNDDDDDEELPASLVQVMKKEEFWNWLQEWTSAYMGLLITRIHEMVKEEVKKQLDERNPGKPENEKEVEIVSDPDKNDTTEEIEKLEENNTSKPTSTEEMATAESVESANENADDKAESVVENSNNILATIATTDPAIDLRFASNEDDKDSKDLDNKPIKIEAHTIYGNALGNDKVTNVFVFLEKPSEDTIEILKPFLSGIQAEGVTTIVETSKKSTDSSNEVIIEAAPNKIDEKEGASETSLSNIKEETVIEREKNSKTDEIISERDEKISGLEEKSSKDEKISEEDEKITKQEKKINNEEEIIEKEDGIKSIEEKDSVTDVAKETKEVNAKSEDDKKEEEIE